MAPKGHTNIAQTKRIQVSLDELSYALLGRIAGIGMEGRSHAEVASKAIRDWLKENATKAIQQGEEFQEMIEHKNKIEE